MDGCPHHNIDKCNLHLSSRFVLVKSFSVIIPPLSTSPVVVCMYGRQHIRFILRLLDLCLNSFPLNAVPLSVLIVWGILFENLYCSRTVLAVRLVEASHMHAADYLLYWSIDFSMKNFRCLHVIGPMKANSISWFAFPTGGR